METMIKLYILGLSNEDIANDVSDIIDTMQNEEKVALRLQLEGLKLPLMRNLYYDYGKQCWI